MADFSRGSLRPRAAQRTRSNFATRTANDDADQLQRRYSLLPPGSPQDELVPSLAEVRQHEQENALDPLYNVSDTAPPSHAQHQGVLNSLFSTGSERPSPVRQRSANSHRKSEGARSHHESKHGNGKTKTSSHPRPVGGSSKLGTFAGVFVPTTLNVLSILMFLRFGFILGQTGVVGMLAMLVACYAINLVTTLSISAIATNGTVRGGGAYYLISRSLGPEFGGSIGLVFYLGSVFNTGMNAVGLIDCFVENFGSEVGNWSHWIPEGFWYQYAWATIVLLACTLICLAGSGLFARASNGLLVILLVATFSIPISAFIVPPFESTKLGIQYTGLSMSTLKENLMPHFTKGAAGSQIKGKENYQDIFGILFPATGGIFAGASMSGDLKHPSKAIPKGTLYGLAITFVSYALVILSMGASITRTSFYNNTNVIQLVNASETIVLLGEFATSFFSSLMGVIGSAKLLQALARDNLLPGLSIFAQGTKKADEPIYAIIVTYIVAQLTMLADINRIASFVTMAYLMTFLVTNLACFLLKISSAPNFRPSFRFFNWWTAAIGTVVSGVTMFFVDGFYASCCVVILIIIFMIIHYTTPPKSWGDVSQSLIYHQVRKYLLRLRQEHVKFWRPQILLLINDPRRQYKLIQFCNSLKKGALFVLGHVIVAEDFGEAVPEARKQQTAWTKYIDFSKIKAFVNISISPTIEWGARNIVLGAGLGGMRPNIVVMGFYNLPELRDSRPLVDVPSPQPSRPATGTRTPMKATGKSQKVEDKLRGTLPTDTIRRESAISAASYVTILEDLLLRVQINVAVAKGFHELELPLPKRSMRQSLVSLFNKASHDGQPTNTKKYIDLWPIQMSAEIATAAEGGDPRRNVLTTNFDTYTLILQLGCILNTVPSWKRAYTLRVAVFVEYESDVEEERARVTTLLVNLRIQAKVVVLWLASGDLATYQIIVNGNMEHQGSDALTDVETALRDEEWWQDIQKIRGREGNVSASQELAQVEGFLDAAHNWPNPSVQHGRREDMVKRFDGLRRMLHKSRRKSISQLSQSGINMSMQTHRLPEGLVAGHGIASDSSSTSSDSDSDDWDSQSRGGDDETASEGDAEEWESESNGSRVRAPRERSFSLGESMRPLLSKKGLRAAAQQFAASLMPLASRTDEDRVQKDSGATGSDSALLTPPRGGSTVQSSTHAPGDASLMPAGRSVSSENRLSSRPSFTRGKSVPKFTSKPVPRTEVKADDGPGPSIMFSESPEEHRLGGDKNHPGRSIYARAQASNEANGGERSASPASPSSPPSGFPSLQALPFSFNDLPSRAQHLILNELIRKNSAETAVLFTTLPSPVDGTGNSEEESVRYLSDLEVLCQGLPPCLMVHSNSMTVTMNL